MEPMEPGYPCEINKESIEFTNVKDFHHVIENKLYMKLLNEINILQCLLNEKRLSLIDSDKIFSSINIYKILYKQNNLRINSIIASTNLYYKYILFVIERIKYQIKYPKNITNSKINISLLDCKNISDFFNSSLYKETTKANRYNNLMRVFKIIFMNEKRPFPTKLFIEKKPKKTVLFNRNERINILYKMLSFNDINIILFWYLSFYLGLSLDETANIIMENISISNKKLYLIRNEKQIFRNINDKICMIINKMNINNNMQQKDYLLFFSIYEKKILVE